MENIKGVEILASEQCHRRLGVASEKLHHPQVMYSWRRPSRILPLMLSLRPTFLGNTEFAWGWLGKGNKQKEKDNSAEDKNLKYRHCSWSEVVKESPAAQGNAVASGTCHSQPSVSVLAPTSSQLRTVKLNDLNPIKYIPVKKLYLYLLQ